MLFYDRIDVSEGIYLDKTSASKDICVIFVTTATLKIKSLRLNPMFVMGVMVINDVCWP